MGQSAYIRFVKGSAVDSLSLDELREQLEQYQEQMSLTGKQLGWDYKDAAFPYTIETKPEGEGKWFYLKGKNEMYHHIIFGIGSEVPESGEAEPVHYVQVVLPDGCTHGDKSKANEYCKFIASRLKAELQLFNGRKMLYNLRK